MIPVLPRFCTFFFSVLFLQLLSLTLDRMRAFVLPAIQWYPCYNVRDNILSLFCLNSNEYVLRMRESLPVIFWNMSMFHEYTSNYIKLTYFRYPLRDSTLQRLLVIARRNIRSGKPGFDLGILTSNFFVSNPGYSWYNNSSEKFEEWSEVYFLLRILKNVKQERGLSAVNLKNLQLLYPQGRKK